MSAPREHELPATLVELAGNRLRDAILSGSLEPGEKIVEEQLCADFGISRAPLREALAQMRSAVTELERDDAHRAFHAAVVGLADNRQLNFALEPILLKLQLPMAVNLREEARHQHGSDGIERHQAILRALEANDAAVVLAAMHDHGHLTYLGL